MKPNQILTIVLLLSCFMMPLSVFAADGDLDTTYGANGLAWTYETGLGAAVDVAIQSGDKSVVLAPKNNDFAILRFNADGSRDMTFGTGGETIITFKDPHSTMETKDVPYAVTVQADGKIVVAGSTEPLLTGRARHFAIARVNLNGGLDATFGSGGIVVTDFFGEPDAAYDVIVQADKKIVAVGETSLNQNIKFGIARYNSDGSLDSSFAHAGIKTIGWGYGYSVANALAQQSDGKLVVIGTSEAPPSTFALARLRINGTLDPSFGSSGLVSTTLSGGFSSASEARSVAIAPDGKIVVGGGNYLAAGNYHIARYLSDGSLDPSFGNGGKMISPQWMWEPTPRTIAISNGKIILAGYSANLYAVCGAAFRLNATILKYNDDGTPDTSFGAGGAVYFNQYPETLSYCNSGMTVSAMALQSDGKILLASGDLLNSSNVGLIVARFEN